MASKFLNYIIESSVQPVKTNVLWIKDGIPYYYNNKWKPLLAGGSGGGEGGGSDSPIIYGNAPFSAVLRSANNKTFGNFSTALGYGLTTYNDNEVAVGRYNKSTEATHPKLATIFSVGIGTEDNRSNAFEIKANGDIYYGGVNLNTTLSDINFSIDELSGTIISTVSNVSELEEKYSQIKQSADAITLEVGKLSTDLEGNVKDLESRITQTAENITLEVNKKVQSLDGKVEEASSKIDQTADQIRLEVTETIKDIDGKIEENASSITQTAKEIRAEVTSVTGTLNGKIEKASTAITQTAEKIESVASKTSELEGKTLTYDSKFTQTAEEIAAAVGRIEVTEEGLIEAKTSITQTANSIRSEVSEQVRTLGGRIDQNTTSITQTKDSINLRVDSLEGTLDEKTGELSGQITKASSAIEQLKDSINLKVDNDTFNTLKGTVEKQGSSILLNAESINSKVEKETFDALSGSVEDGFTEVEQTISGITTTIKTQEGQITSITSTINGLSVALGKAEAKIESLENQSDGAIDTHFGNVTPTLENAPAINWSDEEKKNHTGDLYYNNTSGEAFRFSYDPSTKTYMWVELTDTALTEALGKISKLEEAIDGKVTIFYTTPQNYKEGDLWFVDQDYEAYGDLPALVKGQMVTAKIDNSIFDRTDWEDRTNFASKEEVEASVSNLNDYIDGAFADGILEEAEIAQIQELKRSFELTFSEITEGYNILLISAIATEEDKTTLQKDYNALKNAYDLLIESIEGLLDGSYSIDDYKTNYDSFLEAVKKYYNTSSKYTNSIQSAISSTIDTLVSITSDGVLTPVEKTPLFNTWKSIAEEFTANRGIALNYKIIELVNGEYQKREDIYEHDDYWLVYDNYQKSYIPIKEFFTASKDGKNILGFDAMHENTVLPEDFSLVSITSDLESYYANLALFAEMISKITTDITDAHDKAIINANKLADRLKPEDNITVIGDGVVLSSVIAVQSEGKIQAGLNASNIIKDNNPSVNDNHGRIIFASGIDGKENWNEATTIIYEDGHVVFNSGEIKDNVKIGNALINSVVDEQIDLLSYTRKVLQSDGSYKVVSTPLFFVTTDENDVITGIHTPYNFYSEREIAAGGIGSPYEGDDGDIVGANVSIFVNGQQYNPDSLTGIIKLPDYPTQLNWSSIKDRPINLSQFNNDTKFISGITSKMITDALTYVPLSGGDLQRELNIIDSKFSKEITTIKAKDSAQDTSISEIIARLAEAEKITNLFEANENGVRVKDNFYSDGEISAGGSGEEGDFSAEGTVTGIKVAEGNIVYPDNNGTVDLSDVLEDVIGGIDLTPFATKDEVDDRFDELVNGAPAALDTLKEIADALAENDNEIGAIVTEIGTKATKTEVKGIDDKYAAEVNSLKAKDTAQDTAHDNLAKRVTTNEGSISNIRENIADINEKDVEQDEELASINDGLPAIKQWYNEVGRKIGYDEQGIYTRENFRSYKEISAGGAGSESEGGGGSGEIGGIQIEIIDNDFPDTPEGIYQEGSQVLGYDSGKGVWTNKVTMYKHNQAQSSKTWTINHNLGKMPNVKVIDSQGELVFGTVVYDKDDLLNKLTITFGGAFAGTAYLD